MIFTRYVVEAMALDGILNIIVVVDEDEGVVVDKLPNKTFGLALKFIPFIFTLAPAKPVEGFIPIIYGAPRKTVIGFVGSPAPLPLTAIVNEVLVQGLVLADTLTL